MGIALAWVVILWIVIVTLWELFDKPVERKYKSNFFLAFNFVVNIVILALAIIYLVDYY